jgi:hypothetical protein
MEAEFTRLINRSYINTIREACRTVEIKEEFVQGEVASLIKVHFFEQQKLYSHEIW